MVQASNIDAQHVAWIFTGPDSELSADMRLYAAPAQRHINLDVNVTQSEKTSDLFLQLLDPEQRIFKFKRLAATCSDQYSCGHRLDTARESQHGPDYSTRLSIQVPILISTHRPRTFASYAITEQVIYPYFKNYVDRYLAKSLGWKHESP